MSPNQTSSSNPPASGRSPNERSSYMPMKNPFPGVDDVIIFNTAKRQKLAYLTQGFYVGKWRFDRLFPQAIQIHEAHKDGKVLRAARFALEKLKKKLNKNLELEKIVRVNEELVSGIMFYLTIKASDNNFYEAKVYRPIRQKLKLRFIRPAVHYPRVNAKFLKYDAPEDEATKDDDDDEDGLCDDDAPDDEVNDDDDEPSDDDVPDEEPCDDDDDIPEDFVCDDDSLEDDVSDDDAVDSY